MKLLARVELREGRAVAELVPGTPPFDVRDCRVPVGMIARFTIAELAAPTVDAIVELYARRQQASRTDLAPLQRSESWRATLGDFLALPNGEAHFDAIPLQFGAEEVWAFTGDAGAILRANLKVDLAYRKPTLASAPSVLRFLRLIGGPDAAELVAELAGLESVDQMLALDHALGHALASGPPRRTSELAALAEVIPDGIGFTFESRAWREWWWRLGFASRDRDFLRAVAYTVGAAQARWRRAGHAGDDGPVHDALARMEAAPECRWFTAPPRFHAGPAYPAYETRDGHFQALAALEFAADRLGDIDGNDEALRELATLVLEQLQS